MHLISGSNPTDIYAGQSRSLPAMFMMGGSDTEPKLRVNWTEDGDTKTDEYFVN